MEWVELAPGRRAVLREMFAACPGLHGGIAAVLDGGMGAAYVDDVDRPRIGYLQAGFGIFAGEPIRALVAPKMRGALMAPAGEWVELFKDMVGERLQIYRRVDFGAAPRDRDRLRELADLSAEFSMHRVGAADVVEYEALDSSFVDNFPSYTAFLRDGVGFAVKRDGKIVAGCSSYLIGGGKLEIEINTHADFRRRGLATAVAATMIEHCLDEGIEPCWDAANESSVGLAEKLGFGDPRPYDAYWIKAANSD